jgi:hypothetical protein
LQYLGTVTTLISMWYNENHAWMGKKRYSKARIKVGHYHTLENARGNLYVAIRKRLGLTRVAMSRLLDIGEETLRYRERMKRVYHPCEILALLEVSNMSLEEFIQLLNDIA